MQVIVQGQQVDVGEALRGYVEDKLSDTCTKFFSHTIQGNVHISREASGFRTDITLSVGNGILLKASANDPADPYPAFDQANNKLMKQLKKYKDRLRDHHHTVSKGDFPLPTAANEYSFEQDAIEHGEGGDNPLILAELPTQVQTLAVADAVMRMDLADLNALLFRNPKHGRINLVYRRKDGQIGWVDPQEKEQASTKTTAKTAAPQKKAATKTTAKKPVAVKKKAAPKAKAKKTAAKTAKKPLKKAVKPASKTSKKAKKR